MATFSDPCTEEVEGADVILIAQTPRWHLIHINEHTGPSYYEAHTHENGSQLERGLLITTDDALARRWFSIASQTDPFPKPPAREDRGWLTVEEMA